MTASFVFYMNGCNYVGYNWTLVDRCYLDTSKIPVKKWKDFLTSLGVLEFLAVRQKTLTFSCSELVGHIVVTMHTVYCPASVVYLSDLQDEWHWLKLPSGEVLLFQTQCTVHLPHYQD